MPSTLDFFREAILEPALRLAADYPADHPNIVADVGAVEVAQWAQLGAEIGYLDARQTVELISSSQLIFTAWDRVRNVYAEKNLDLFLSPNQGGTSILNADRFKGYDEDSRTRNFLQSTFQTILLLTLEYLISRESTYFIESIGWTDTSE